MKRKTEYYDTLGFFVLMFLIAFILGTPFNYFAISPHPFWIIVILISTQYGTNAGLFSAAFASFILLVGPLPARSILQDRFVYFFEIAKLPLLWFSASILLGELRNKHIKERNHLRAQLNSAEEKEE